MKSIEISRDTNVFTDLPFGPELRDWRTFSSVFPFQKPRRQQMQALPVIDWALKHYRYVLFEAPPGSGKTGVYATIMRLPEYASAYVTTPRIGLQDQLIRDFGHWLTKIDGRSNFTCRLARTVDGCTECLKLHKGMCPTGEEVCTVDKAPCNTFQTSEFECPFRPRPRRTTIPDRVLKQYFSGLIRPSEMSEVPADCVRPEYAYSNFLLDSDSLCDYYKSVLTAMFSDYVCANKAYLITDAMYRHRFPVRSLLVSDEVHTDRAALINSRSSTIYQRDIDTWINSSLGPRHGLMSPIDVPDIELSPEKDERMQQRLELLRWIGTLRALLSTYSTDPSLQGLINNRDRAAYRLDRFIRRIETAYNCLSEEIRNQEDMYAWTVSAGKWISFSPITAAGFGSVYTSLGRKFLGVSATIGDADTLIRHIGGSPEDSIVVRIAYSEVPISRRRIFVVSDDVGPINIRNRDQAIPRLSRAISKLMRHYEGIHGIVLPNSKYMETGIVEHLDKDVKPKMIQHSSNPRERSKTIEDFVTGSSMGYKPGDSMIIGLNVIPKIPFGDLGDVSIRMLKNIDSADYTANAIRGLIQRMGRTIRDTKDFSEVVILDASIIGLLGRHPEMFPSHVLESISIVSTVDDVIRTDTEVKRHIRRGAGTVPWLISTYVSEGLDFSNRTVCSHCSRTYTVGLDTCPYCGIDLAEEDVSRVKVMDIFDVDDEKIAYLNVKRKRRNSVQSRIDSMSLT